LAGTKISEVTYFVSGGM